MKLAVIVLIFVLDVALSITLRKECPPGEVHKSCALMQEYTCWLREDRMQRVKSLAKRLTHCKAGCFCKKGLVREYPSGYCIAGAGCRDRNLLSVLMSIPTGSPFGFDIRILIILKGRQRIIALLHLSVKYPSHSIFRKGLVREYPGGSCIAGAGCRDRNLLAVLMSIPTGSPFGFKANC
ncbi:hypothetical protein HF086_007008 [Spodoptera exigua]|uniref:TIL domain-containing protein n=1 Tax=Spodoptera exigua TaxID=7107 RepID=A0A922MHM1_SPOEX|nr:hypothetical protein HF086_007008 [Spodoptera exigua]